jgi:hypothetical protein
MEDSPFSELLEEINRSAEVSGQDQRMESFFEWCSNTIGEIGQRISDPMAMIAAVKALAGSFQPPSNA